MPVLTSQLAYWCKFAECMWKEQFPCIWPCVWADGIHCT